MIQSLGVVLIAQTNWWCNRHDQTNSFVVLPHQMTHLRRLHSTKLFPLKSNSFLANLSRTRKLHHLKGVCQDEQQTSLQHSYGALATVEHHGWHAFPPKSQEPSQLTINLRHNKETSKYEELDEWMWQASSVKESTTTKNSLNGEIRLIFNIFKLTI